MKKKERIIVLESRVRTLEAEVKSLKITPLAVPKDSPEFIDLVREVKGIDTNAAAYLQENAKVACRTSHAPSIMNAFRWVDTPQGSIIWSILYRVLKNYVRK